MAVRGSRLGARFTVAGITEYLKKKEKSRLEYERIKADIEQESEDMMIMRNGIYLMLRKVSV